jgi:hypothetical protein
LDTSSPKIVVVWTSQDSEQDKVSLDDKSRRLYRTSPSLAFVSAPAYTRSASPVVPPPSPPTHQTSHPQTDHSHLLRPTLPPPSSRLPIHTKHEHKHPCPGKSHSTIPNPPLPPSIACSAHNSRIEIRLPLTVHAALLNRRFRLKFKAHDDGKDMSVRVKEWVNIHLRRQQENWKTKGSKKEREIE